MAKVGATHYFPEGHCDIFFFLLGHPKGLGFCNGLNVLMILASFAESVIKSILICFLK